MNADVPLRRPLPRPTEIDLLAGLLLGPDPHSPSLGPATGKGVRDALEQAMLPALTTPPCFVSFSGGRDSSAVLAIATALARRHGLPDPIPASMRFEGAPDTEETEWQELVVGHLGINEHAVVDVGEEADALGPTATGVLRRHGQVWPANAYLHGPVFNLARGGSLLTGVGGDELFSTRASRLVFVVRRRVRPRAQDVRALALAAMPRWIRTAVWRRRHYEPYRWFTPQGARVAGRALAREDVSWPQRWDASVRHWYRTRSYAATMEVLSHLAADADITVVNPLLDPMVMAEMARVGGPTGFRDRSSAMLLLFGDLLPQAVLDRPTKATFDLPVWGPHARAFADAWGGQGIDARHVDPAALRREWLSEQPHAASMAWLHRAWLHSSEGQPPPTTASS